MNKKFLLMITSLMFLLSTNVKAGQYYFVNHLNEDLTINFTEVNYPNSERNLQVLVKAGGFVRTETNPEDLILVRKISTKSATRQRDFSSSLFCELLINKTYPQGTLIFKPFSHDSITCHTAGK